MAEFEIDPEFQSLLPSLSQDEFDRLRNDITKNGCRDKLVLWREWNVLIDGHNRYDICTTLDLPFETTELSFHGRDEVKMWMFKNQLGRRNLTDFQRAEIALLMKPVVESQAKTKQAVGRPKDSHKEVVEILPQDNKPAPKTRDIVGAIAGVSGKTIDKVEKILAEATPEVIQQVRNKEKSIEAAYKEVATPPTKPISESTTAKAIEPRGVGIERAHEAIARLKKIPVGDALRKRAFEIVSDWMTHNP